MYRDNDGGSTFRTGKDQSLQCDQYYIYGCTDSAGDDPWQHFPGTERYLVGTVIDFHCERRVICDCVPVGNPHKETGGCLTENKYRMSERNRQRLGVFGIPVGGRGTAFATPELTDKITHIFETGV